MRRRGRKSPFLLTLLPAFEPERGVANDQRTTSGSAATKGVRSEGAKRPNMPRREAARTIPPGVPLFSAYLPPSMRDRVLSRLLSDSGDRWLPDAECHERRASCVVRRLAIAVERRPVRIGGESIDDGDIQTF